MTVALFALCYTSDSLVKFHIYYRKGFEECNSADLIGLLHFKIIIILNGNNQENYILKIKIM